MYALRTIAGATLFAQLEAGTAPAPAFTNLIFGRNNAVPADGDTVAELGTLLPMSAAASPVKGDQDPRNTGRGANVWTWTFELPSTTPAQVGSNVALAQNPLQLADALAVHGRITLNTETYRRLMVWVNLSATGATILSRFVQDPAEAARRRTSAARTDLVYGGSGSISLRVGETTGSYRTGSKPPFRAQIFDDAGLFVRPSDVRTVRQEIEEYDPGKGWDAVVKKDLHECFLDDTTTEASSKFPHRGGFNFAAKLDQKYTRTTRELRVRYVITLTNGEQRTYLHNVRIRR